MSEVTDCTVGDAIAYETTSFDDLDDKMAEWGDTFLTAKKADGIARMMIQICVRGDLPPSKQTSRTLNSVVLSASFSLQGGKKAILEGLSNLDDCEKDDTPVDELKRDILKIMLSPDTVLSATVIAQTFDRKDQLISQKAWKVIQ